MGRNAGFAAAVNRGIEESRGDWLAVLNSDVEMAPDYLAKLLAAARPAAPGSPPARFWRRVERPDRRHLRRDVPRRNGVARGQRPDRRGRVLRPSRQIWSPPFTAVLLRTEVFAAPACSENRFESYLEDVDFGLRCAARELAGIYVPAALAWHQGSATLGRWHPETVRRMARNQLFLVARHYPGSLAAAALVLGDGGGANSVGRTGAAPRSRPGLAARRFPGAARIFRGAQILHASSMPGRWTICCGRTSA
jgi:GT2 family glycosyltransferase